MSLTGMTYLEPTLSALVTTALFRANGSETQARLLVDAALNDPAERAKVLEAEFRYAMRAYLSQSSKNTKSAA